MSLPLSYAANENRPRRRLLRKLLRVLIVAGGIWVAGVGVFSGYMSWLQHQFLRPPSPGRIIMTDNPDSIKKLQGDPAYEITSGGARRIADAAWRRYIQFRTANTETQAPLFLGELTNPTTHGKTIVAVHPDGSGGIIRLAFAPKYIYLTPWRREWLVYWMGGNAEMFGWVTYYEGSIDPSDPNRFFIPFDSDGGSGKVIGQLSATGSVGISWSFDGLGATAPVSN
jgi:hypothetical protein